MKKGFFLPNVNRPTGKMPTKNAVKENGSTKAGEVPDA
jgi:hypothetical protein